MALITPTTLHYRHYLYITSQRNFNYIIFRGNFFLKTSSWCRFVRSCFDARCGHICQWPVTSDHNLLTTPRFDVSNSVELDVAMRWSARLLLLLTGLIRCIVIIIMYWWRSRLLPRPHTVHLYDVMWLALTHLTWARSRRAPSRRPCVHHSRAGREQRSQLWAVAQLRWTVALVSLDATLSTHSRYTSDYTFNFNY